jgi:gamma-glutamylcyclotransferase (GGCT)/AIG2-like uncharacterized protein YtfP
VISELFVYGTLQPGDVRWPLLEPYVDGSGETDAAIGQLYDTGLGYPGAVFGGDDRILGRTYQLRKERLDEALLALDAEESSVAGGYRRVPIETLSGRQAWAYEYGGGLDLTPIEGGDWANR